jgi:hypothetical protein
MSRRSALPRFGSTLDFEINMKPGSVERAYSVMQKEVIGADHGTRGDPGRHEVDWGLTGRREVVTPAQKRVIVDETTARNRRSGIEGW